MARDLRLREVQIGSRLIGRPAILQEIGHDAADRTRGEQR